MTSSEMHVKRLPNDIGGLKSGQVTQNDHALLAWEKRCHALADVLDYYKIINTEEKRRGVESLGSEVIDNLSYYERWVVVFANICFQKGLLDSGEVARRMQEVQARWNHLDSDGAIP